jgi:hypothetical protein
MSSCAEHSQIIWLYVCGQPTENQVEQTLHLCVALCVYALQQQLRRRVVS